ncbi:MAG: class I SAM-dependent RNA methyltransferase [Deltaproteobacteria bacterium]|nr:class I SAM-dependent RNA methyltransferase [Deltaproteobacteria bacterium]
MIPPSPHILCPYFGTCGGCSYQHLPYAEELRFKEEELKALFLKEDFQITESTFLPILPSPKEYHYRHRLDISLRKDKRREYFFGFVSEAPKRILAIESCAIAMEQLSDFIPQLREAAIARLPANYKIASIVAKVSEEGKIYWGGIGRKSLVQKPEDYLFTEVEGQKIYFSLSTFFQANFSILSPLYKKLLELQNWNSETLFLDLYGGVGLFSILMARHIKEVWMIEEHPYSIGLAKYNQEQHQMKSWKIIEGRVEDLLENLLQKADLTNTVALVDPPRKGLHEQAANCLAQSSLKTLFYLSCHPVSLIRDLKILIQAGWQIDKIFPCDFFPKTHHLETLVKLERWQSG